MPLRSMASSPETHLVITADGDVTRADIKACLSGLKDQPLDRRGKLISLLGARLALTPEDIDMLGQIFRRYCSKPLPGPIALVVHDPMNLDMAVLIKRRVEAGRFRVFANRVQAERWLSEQGAPVPA